MEIIYPVGSDASNINVTSQKRLLRVVQGQTQATPTSGYLDPSLRNTSGGIRRPLSTDKEGVVPSEGAAAAPFTRTASAFVFENSLTPGLVLVKTKGENYAIADGGACKKASESGGAVFGLLGQWVGGTFDGVKNTSNISAWQGPDSQYDILAPGFDATELATNAAKMEKGQRVPLWVGADGRLTSAKKELEVEVAELVEYNPSVIRVRLLI
jgi:hypothetical protein